LKLKIKLTKQWKCENSSSLQKFSFINTHSCKRGVGEGGGKGGKKEDGHNKNQTNTQKGTPAMSEGPPSAKRKCGL
jgi:hypothetical protein